MPSTLEKVHTLHEQEDDQISKHKKYLRTLLVLFQSSERGSGFYSRAGSNFAATVFIHQYAFPTGFIMVKSENQI